MMGTAVKICGLTRPADAALAAELGAAALGVVFAPSPRRVTASRAAEIFDAAPGTVRVGVFADQPAELIAEAALACRLDWVQLSGHEPPELASRVTELLAGPAPGVRVLKAVHVSGPRDLAAAAAYPASAFLLDAPVTDGRLGGTGRRFDWSSADRLPWPRERVLVAGGLDPGNVAAVIERLRPGGVDVSSGVETAPGRKDRERMRAFFQAVAAARGGVRPSTLFTTDR